MITPIRGRKLKDYATIYDGYKFTDDNPDKGTETYNERIKSLIDIVYR